MSKKIDQDELLAKLQKSAAKTRAPRLDESLLLSASSDNPKFGPRRFLTPKLIVNLVGGAAVLAGVFAFVSSNNSKLSELAILDSEVSKGSALMVMGDTTFTEADLLARNGKSLAEYGQAAVGNYVSNNPTEYVDRMWQGFSDSIQDSVWIFVVTDSVYIPNNPIQTTFYPIGSDQDLSNYIDQIGDSTEAEGIRLLIQSSDQKLYPLVVPPNFTPGSLYLQLRDSLLQQTYTKVIY